MTRANIHVIKRETKQDNNRSEKGYPLMNSIGIEKPIPATSVRQPHPVKGLNDLGGVCC